MNLLENCATGKQSHRLSLTRRTASSASLPNPNAYWEQLRINTLKPVRKGAGFSPHRNRRLFL